MYLFIVILVNLLSTASAIGGWETGHLFFSKSFREYGQAHQNEHSHGTDSNQERRIHPMSGEDDINDEDSSSATTNDNRKNNKKKRHVSEVTMTSTPAATGDRTVVKNMSNKKQQQQVIVVGSPTSSTVSPAFVGKSRRAASMTLDEKDLERISFVGRSPFL